MSLFSDSLYSDLQRLRELVEDTVSYKPKNSNVVSENYKDGKAHGEFKYTDRPTEYYILGKLVTKDEWETYEENNTKYRLFLFGKEYLVPMSKLKKIKELLES